MAGKEYKNKFNPLLEKGIQKIQEKTIIDVTYEELTEKINNSELIPGHYYRITDYQTIYDQRRDSYVTKYGNVEPLIVLAIMDNELATVAYSEQYPQDIIYYDFHNNKTYFTNIDRPGFIIYRKDINQNISATYDFRNVLNIYFAIVAPDFVPEQYYSKGDLIKDNSDNILVCIKNGNPTDITREYFINTGLVNNEICISHREVNIPAYANFKPEYINYEDYVEYNTFAETNNPTNVSTRFLNCHINSNVKYIPNVTLLRVWDKFNSSYETNITIKNTTDALIMSQKIHDIEINTSKAIYIGNNLGNEIANSFLSYLENTNIPGIQNTRIIDISRVSFGFVTNSELYMFSNSVIGYCESSFIKLADYSFVSLLRCNIDDIRNCNFSSQFINVRTDTLPFVNYNASTSIRNLVGIINTSSPLDITSFTDLYNYTTTKTIDVNSNGDIIFSYYDENNNKIITKIN